MILIAWELVSRSHLTLAKFGLGFFFRSAWDPVNGDFGALPFIYGTLVISFLALLMAVPLALGVAIFLTEMCPRAPRAALLPYRTARRHPQRRLRPLGGLRAGPPAARHVPVADRYLGWTGFFSGPNCGFGMLAAGVILAIMILPIISSLTRDVMTAVPDSQREAVLALGATRWEMIRIGVLRNARIGIVGAIILGLGRALGETMAVTMVIGNHPEIASRSLPRLHAWPASSPTSSPRPPATSISARSSRSASRSSSSPSSSTPSPACWSGRSRAALRHGCTDMATQPFNSQPRPWTSSRNPCA